MATGKVSTPEEKVVHHDDQSLKGALFSSLVFVGGGIVSFIVLLFVIYMMRVGI
ncbi:hypothetical protein [Virgibacillus sp. SK37]|uniref:hypothetical protein n=1 Tax=Virgibacillus sp. SK37 TaxID=403957 RepID=UPI0004D17E45|nr:hypothetical protein [Virgibacillus sp. SK37]AIF45218.1 hypothetical protein X953_05305 [Virgibacillus sp. SK37]